MKLQKTANRLKRWWAGPTAFVICCALVALNPSVLFSHELKVGNLVVHSGAPLPANAAELFEGVRARAAKSPFFSTTERYDVYLCDTPAHFAFFVPWARNVGGVSLTGLTGNVFIRPANVGADRVIGPSGQEVPGVRTLTYFVAHELTHTAMARRLGRLAYHRLETWQQEGLADLVGKDGAFDFDAERARYRAGHPDLSHESSGLYLEYQLVVEQLLREGLTVEDLARSPMDAAPVRARLRD